MSSSRNLVAHFCDQWLAANPGGELVHRDASGGAIPHIDGGLVQAFFTPPEALNDEQRAALAFSAELVAELKDADELVFGVAMQNFGVPSSLKSWVDHVVRVGHTFHYTATGPVGLLSDRKVTILLASGGSYHEGPMAAFNHASTYIGHIMGQWDCGRSEPCSPPIWPWVTKPRRTASSPQRRRSAACSPEHGRRYLTRSDLDVERARALRCAGSCSFGARFSGSAILQRAAAP